jgi:WD domain, G-beta repeat
MLSRRRKRRFLPVAKKPTGVVELAGHGENERVNCIVALPGGDRVATASSDGKVRVFTVATGALRHELDAHNGGIWGRALAALGDDIIVSGGGAAVDGKVVTWNAATGERVGEAAAGSGVFALAALDGGRFVAGTTAGDVVFYTHHGGRGVEEVARVAGAHNGWVVDFSVCGGRLTTASNDKTAAVWSVYSRERLARLSGHTNVVVSVDMNDRLVVTASWDQTVRVYNAEGGYSVIALLDWLHSSLVNFVALFGDDHILSTSKDYTLCVTQLSSSAVVARTELSDVVMYAAALLDGRLAVCGRRGCAALIDAPDTAADVLTALGAAAFPEAAAASSALAVAEPLPPLQDAVVRVATGEQTAAAACRELISADACSASLAEWSAGHLLLMQAVRDGEIIGDRRYDGIDFYWVKKLYLPTRLLVLGHGEDYATVERFLLQAEAAGVIQSADAMVVAMAAHLDLRDNVNELCSAGEQILCAISHIFMRQADVEQRLCDLENGLERFKRVQQWTQLANVVFSLIPFAGGTITCVIAGAVPVLDGMQISNMVESLIGVITGNQAAATAPLFNRFMSSGNDLLSEDGLAVIPADARVLLERVASELGLSMEGLRQILKQTALRMVEGGECGGPSVTVEVLSEDGNDKEDREEATNSTVIEDVVVGDVIEQFEGVTVSEKPSPSVYDALDDSSGGAGSVDAKPTGLRLAVAVASVGALVLSLLVRNALSTRIVGGGNGTELGGGFGGAGGYGRKVMPSATFALVGPAEYVGPEFHQVGAEGSTGERMRVLEERVRGAHAERARGCEGGDGGTEGGGRDGDA